ILHREDPMSQPGESEPGQFQPATATFVSRAPTPPETPTRRPRPVLSWTAALGALVVAILLARTLAAYPLLPLRLSRPSAPADTSQQSGVTFSAQNAQFAAVSMSSPQSGWALGYFDGDGSDPPGPLLLRYGVRDWVRVESPDNQQLFSLAAVSDDEAWPTGTRGIYHYQNGVWSVEYQLPDPSTFLSSIAMVSSDEGWVLGQVSQPDGPNSLVMHRLHGAWIAEQIPYLSKPSPLRAPNNIVLRAIAMRSPTEGWIAG